MKKKFKFKGWQKALLIIIPYLVFVIIAQVTFAKIADFEIDPMPSDSVDVFLLFFAAFLGTILVVWLFMKFIDKEAFSNVGFKKDHWLKGLALGTLMGFGLIAIGFFTLKILGEINVESLNFNITEIVFALLISACVGISEELMFRGYILRNLLTSFKPALALIISTVLFTLIHIGNPDVTIVGYTNIVLASFLLGLLYIYTKNLWVSIGLHFGWNLFQGLFGFNISGIDAYSVIEFSVLENNTLNGGSNGFEGSSLSVIVLLISIGAVMLYFRKNNQNTALSHTTNQ